MSHEDLDRKRQLVVALKRAHATKLRECFDPFDPDSRATPKQDEILRDNANVLYQYVQGGNQTGKSQTGGRLASWYFERNHKYLDIDALWPDEPMLILVVGRLANQVEELFEKKIKPYLDPGSFRENRQGGSLQYVAHRSNGSKIVFCSHANPIEAREKLQSYTANFVWMDELTDHLGIIEELQRRVQAKRGRMIVTFTPKIRAEAVRKFIETPTEYSRIYKISMLDNPIYAHRKAEILAQIESLPENQRNTILYGDWYIGERAVFTFDPNIHVENPMGYSALWPHVVAVDPAASGQMGYTLWAAPHDHAHRWYCVAAEKFKGGAPSDLVDLVESKCAGTNVIYKIYDTHEAWFGRQASKMKITYRGVPNKHSRKKELIAGLNQAMANGRIRLTTMAPDLAAELSTAQWSETVEDKIVAASSYHLADCAQYFVDMMPSFKEIEIVNYTHDQLLHMANQKRKANEAKRAETKQNWRIVAKRGRVWSR